MYCNVRKTFRLFTLILGLTALFLTVNSTSEAQHMNTMITKLAAGQPVYGIWSSNRDPRMARTIGRTPGIDYVIYDTEHQPFDMHNFHQWLLNLRGIDGKLNVTPIIRIGPYGSEVEYNRWVVKQALDLGAMGIIFPHINTTGDAISAINSMRYPPMKDSTLGGGTRGYAPGEAAALWGISATEYSNQHADLWPLNPNGDLLAIFLIEQREAIENLDAILNVPGVGGVFVGPVDLHSHLGYRGHGYTAPGAGAPAGETAVPEAE